MRSSSQETARPHALAVNANGIPPELKAIDQWVTWRYQWRDAKWTKPPLTTQGDAASSTDPSTWETFSETLAAYQAGGFDGIGLIHLPENNLTGVDIDKCRHPESGALDKQADKFVKTLNTYTECSPTVTDGVAKRGIRAYAHGRKPGRRCKEGPFEMYDGLTAKGEPGGRFLTITGHLIDGSPLTIETRQEQIDRLYEEVFGNKREESNHATNGQQRQAKAPFAKKAEGRTDAPPKLTDEEIFSLLRHAANRDKFNRLMQGDISLYGNDDSKADQALLSLIVFYTVDAAQIERIFNRSKLAEREKWHNRADYRDRSISAALTFITKHYSPGAVFQNYRTAKVVDEEGKEVTVKIGLSAAEIRHRLDSITDHWPKRVGPALFVPGANYLPLWLESTDSFFAWASNRVSGDDSTNQVKWAGGQDKVSQAQFYHHLAQNAEDHDAVQPFPHHPRLDRHYYLHPDMAGGDGAALDWLLRRFCPATRADFDLIHAFFLTLIWGGKPGSRPGFLVDAAEDDGQGGRGVGKTKLAEAGAFIVGGHVDVRQNEDVDKLLSRLLSPAALDRRVVLIDNLKTLRFSSAELEALITNDVISGKRLYVGEGRRPNTLVWAITSNRATMSRDMAQRCVPIRLKRPRRDPSWEADTFAFIENHRWAIIGDLLAELQRPVATLARYSRWSAWEQAVLAHVADPARAQKAIADRQDDVDDDQAEADVVREGFVNALVEHGHNQDTDAVFITSKEAAEIVNQATGEKRPTNKANAFLHTLNIAELRKSNRDCRGWVWRGEECTASEASVPLGPAPAQPFTRTAHSH